MVKGGQEGLKGGGEECGHCLHVFTFEEEWEYWEFQEHLEERVEEGLVEWLVEWSVSSPSSTSDRSSTFDVFCVRPSSSVTCTRALMNHSASSKILTSAINMQTVALLSLLFMNLTDVIDWLTLAWR